MASRRPARRRRVDPRAGGTKPRTSDARQVMDSLRRIVRGLRQSSRSAEDQLGISGAQSFVLQELSRGERLSINELARRTLTDQSSVSVVVKKLTERGLVGSRRSASDARRAEVALTAAGRALVERAPEAAQVRLIAALSSLSAVDRRDLGRLLARLVAGLEAPIGRAPMFFEESGAPRRARSAS